MITDNRKMTAQEIDERVERAVENFMAGYGCCQSVVAAFSDLYGLDETMAKRIAAGFGGGVGRMRMMCGAVSGIVMLVGLDCGQTEGSDREGKSACYKVVQELLAQSQAENGSLICAQDAPLCCQGGKCCPHLCKLSEKEARNLSSPVFQILKKKATTDSSIVAFVSG